MFHAVYKYQSIMTAALRRSSCVRKHISVFSRLENCPTASDVFIFDGSCSTMMDQQLKSFKDRSPQFWSSVCDQIDRQDLEDQICRPQMARCSNCRQWGDQRRRTQSNLGGHDIFAQKYVWKINKMPEFYMIIAWNVSFLIFFWGGGCPTAPSGA